MIYIFDKDSFEYLYIIIDQWIDVKDLCNFASGHISNKITAARLRFQQSIIIHIAELLCFNKLEYLVHLDTK